MYMQLWANSKSAVLPGIFQTEAFYVVNSDIRHERTTDEDILEDVTSGVVSSFRRP